MVVAASDFLLFFPGLAFILLSLAAGAAATPAAPIKEIHLVSLNVGSHARMSGMNADSVLARKGHRVLIDDAFPSPGGSTSHFYHGAMRYVNARDVVEDDLAARLFGPLSDAAGASQGLDDGQSTQTSRLDYPGWSRPGPGRARGSGLDVRMSLRDIIIVKLSVMAHRSLVANFDVEGQALLARAGLEKLREDYHHITPKAVKIVA